MQNDDINFFDLETRGFLLIRGFLGENEIDHFSQDFDAASVGDNSNYHVRHLSIQSREQITQKCLRIADQVRNQTSIDVDTIGECIYFATFTDKRTLTSPHKGKQAFPWHQDHENFWQWQETRNYLNFYIPLVKPVAEQSNLGLLPFDNIRKRNPSLAEALVGFGATRVLKTRRGWVVRNDNADRNLGPLGFDPAEAQEIPHLYPGDLLLMRGDILHCTQDADTRRIAMSIRMLDGKSWVSRSAMVRGGFVKTLMLFNSRAIFNAMLQYFRCLDTEHLTIAMLNRHLQHLRELEQIGYPAPSHCGRLRFLGQLFAERIRAVIKRQPQKPSRVSLTKPTGTERKEASNPKIRRLAENHTEMQPQ